MPDEGAPHAATWMAFGAEVELWGTKLLPIVRNNVASVAKAIAVYEPVKMLVREEDYHIAARLCGPSVGLVVQPLDDVWLRDTGPVFVSNPAGQLGAVGFNFNGWGNKPQPYARDARVAEHLAGAAQATFLKADLVLEGGGIEVDGEGTAIITESCVLNPNRNPGVSKDKCEAELSRLLGLDKIIWLPGIAGKEITDGHTDFYARFTSPGVVVAGLEMDPSFDDDYGVTREHLKMLRASTDARGRRLKVVELPGPTTVRPKYGNEDDFAAGYINFYVCNGAVIAPEFGDPAADRNACERLRELYPGREIIQLNIDGIAAGGGGIHCTTQQQPRS
ncbi:MULTISPECIES: agmatine/peptidylarginine deiminase [unclassified Bradyrhizobium]|uniref:agmatine deiminase family protein n=1 Tax=unclassified Bradyrhizobium TaxID=2631580 RepID=UPI001BA4BB96|nr:MULTISPECIES: agmatine deiminase family protein [unclassified Bradyrhizobium]MBR1204247.1 agmatine deiminase family protein [Bradyrhizobium sp. AUGA SZCCT0124]MBR1309867.1 agmatine deiminase family protein [Bradyrhizobium sp. AUGA SZCCT0051]MBR1340008.1 agmatine deiminase family protein [Bradyrhizobium sp. AUGA SZCCT0105]MBR1354615.1 agmatine deiminase family protein [Bradyrhizobium sp. AUGA SZCCT0045]